MKGYGSIIEQKQQLELVEKEDEIELQTTSSFSPSWSNIRRLCVMAATLVLLVAAMGVSRGGFDPLQQTFALSNSYPIALYTWGTPKWKKYIRLDKDPDTALYHKQIVDHMKPHSGESGATFQQRYYENLRYWEGPGHPLFIILGGEGPLEQILYPFISDVLAPAYGGATFNPEHRYFGVSRPEKTPSNRELREQMTPRQAMKDFVYFAQAMQEKLGCGPRGSDQYCPVVTIGGSYPGLLSALLRINYPDTIDIGYGGGVPFHTWDNSAPEVAAYEYYDYITNIAEQESPGCPAALKETLMKTLEEMKAYDQKNGSHLDLSTLAASYGVCPDTVPNKIKSAESLAQKLMGKVPGHFSGTNMEYYPPNPDRLFIKDCKIFQNSTAAPQERFRNFLINAAKVDQNVNSSCYDLGGGKKQAPVAADDSDKQWNILNCHLAPVMGKSEQSMFYPQKFNPQSDIKACQKDFGITMDPSAMVREFSFSHEDLKKQSHILLTNGVSDGWSALSYLEDINDSVVVMNFENGAHLSELLHFWAPDNNHDTPDIRQGHVDIIELMGKWLHEIKTGKVSA